MKYQPAFTHNHPLFHLMRHFPILAIACLCLLACLHPAQAQKIEASLSSSFLLPGERAILDFILTDGSPPEQLPLSPVPGVTMQKRGFGGPNSVILPSRTIGYSYQYIISATTQGSFTIPALSLRYPGKEITSKPLTFEVINPQELTTQQVILGNRPLRYAAFFRAAKTNPYEGEVVPIELKIYFPADVSVEEWGIPDFERSSLTAWRFEPRPQSGAAMLLGQQCQVATYPSNFSAIKAGPASIGPAKIRLIVEALSFGPFGSQQDLVPLNITAPTLSCNALPLPPGAPASFTNAVGNFTMDIGVAESEVREGDPVNVEIEITGSGNLDSLDPPVLSDPEGWKLYDAARSQLGEERRYNRGTISFTQFMRPTQRQSVIPPFDFTYFDPILAKYQTLRSSPIPLKLLPSTSGAAFLNQAAPPALDTPIERMTDILGLITHAPILIPSKTSLPPYFWHLAPALLLIAVIVAIYLRHFHHLRVKPAHVIQHRQDWKSLTASADSQFLRDAGRFIERWHHDTTNPDLRSILQERDMQCFLPDNLQAPIPAKRKNQILAQLRKLLPLLLLCCLLPEFIQPTAAQETSTAPATPATVADAADLYQKGQYKQAIDAWLAAGPYDTLSPQTLYNIGNACYRMGSAGHAALYYRRALLLDPTLAEAHQNLRFIERKYGSISIQRPDYQRTLTKLPLHWIQNTTWAAAWAILIAILLIPATPRGSKLRIPAVITLIFIPFLLSASILAWHYYPSDAKFSSFAEQAIVTGDKVVLRTDASRTSAEVIDAPSGSLCRIIRRTGKWCYVAFATQTSGWLEASQVEPLIPDQQPTTPILKPAEKSDAAPSA